MANLLLSAIALREYLPGERLPSERELCARLLVNRTAVRDGLRLLEHQKFVEVRRGKYGGAFVLYTSMDLSFERVRGKIEELRQLLEFREFLEPLAAAIAAERIQEPELARLEELHATERDQLEQAGTGEHQLRAIDNEIHELIAAATQNKHFLESVHDIRLRLAIGLDLLSRSPTRRHESTAGHAEILHALRCHDSAAAAAAMEHHAAATRKAVAACLAERGIDLEGAKSNALVSPSGRFNTAESPSANRLP